MRRDSMTGNASIEMESSPEYGERTPGRRRKPVSHRLKSPGYSVTPPSSGSRSMRRRNMVPSFSGTPGRRRQSAGDDLVENLNSALRALGSTPSRLGIESPMPMKSLDADMNKINLDSPTNRRVSIRHDPYDEEGGLMSEKIVRLQQKHARLLQETADMEMKMIKTEERRDVIEQGLKKRNEEMKSMSSKVGELQQNLLNLEEEKQARIQKLDEHIGTKQRQMNDLENSLKEMTFERDSMKRQIETALREKNLVLEEVQHVIAEVERSRATLSEINSSVAEADKKLREVESRRMKVEQEVAAAETAAKESAQARAVTEDLVAEGYALADEQAIRAADAQKKWEEAEMRLSEVQSALVEANARLEERRNMIKEAEAAHVGVKECQTGERKLADLQESIRQQQSLYDKLVTLNDEKLEEYKKLTSCIEKSSVELDADQESKVEKSKEFIQMQKIISQMEVQNQDMKTSVAASQIQLDQCMKEKGDAEKALKEALAEIERLTLRHSSIRTAEMLQRRVEDLEYQLEASLEELERSKNRVSIAEKKAKESDVALEETKVAYEEAYRKLETKKQELLREQDVSTGREHEVQRFEKLIAKCSAEGRDQMKLILVLQKEQKEAKERELRYQEQIDTLRSCLRKEACRRKLLSAGWPEHSKLNGASSVIPKTKSITPYESNDKEVIGADVVNIN